MDRRNYIGAAEAKAIAYEEKERMERLDEQGLCLHCEENPQNPYLNAKVCLDCYKEDIPGGCMAKGCTNSTAGSFQQAELCEVHLVDAIHSAYEDYLEQKSQFDEEQEKLDQMVQEVGFNPANSHKAPRDMTDEEKEVRDKATQVAVHKRDLNFLKGDIKSAMEDLDQPFPEGYEVFG